jgi:ABC-type protease/lipase transport system fused ATPase/permease subunit
MHLEKVMKFTNPLLLAPSATVVISVVAVLVNVVPTSVALSTAGRHTIGIIQKVNAQAREAELLELGKEKSLKFTWDKHTRFLANQHFVDATILSSGARVEVVFHPHFFGNPYVTKVTLLSIWTSQFENSIQLR